MPSFPARSPIEASRIESIAEYWNRRSSGYGLHTRDELNGPEAHRWTAHLKNCCHLEGASVLDVGTGAGFLAILAAKAGATRVTAIDISAEMIRTARLNAQSVEAAVSFAQGSADRLTFPDDTFDLVMSRDVLWNLTNPEGALAEWVRVLKPGGTLFIADAPHSRYLVDEAYRALLESIPPRCRDERYMRNVDPATLEGLARTLPLTDKERPEWELEKLRSLKLQGVATRALHTVGVELEDGIVRRVVKSFIVSAFKPDRIAEDDAQ